MQTDITLSYTEDLTRRSVLYFCWAVTGRLFVMAVILSAFSLVFLLQNGGSSPVIWLIMITLVIVAIFIPAIYFISRKNALRKFHALPNGKATLNIKDDGFTINTSTLPWDTIRKVKKYKEFWIVLLHRGGYFTLPLASLSDEDKAAFLKLAK